MVLRSIQASAAAVLENIQTLTVVILLSPVNMLAVLKPIQASMVLRSIQALAMTIVHGFIQGSAVAIILLLIHASAAATVIGHI